MEAKTGQDLKEMLTEMYVYYFGEVKRRTGKGKDDYQTWKFSGAVDAVSAIFLSLYGGQEMMELWKSQVEKGSEVAENDTATGG